MKIVIQAHRPEFLPATLYFLNKYWPTHPEVMIVTWPPHQLDVKVPVIYLNRDRDFGSNMIRFLDRFYHEKYFVNWLIDYILRQPVDDDVFQAAVRLVKRPAVCSVRLSKHFTPQDGPSLKEDGRFRVLPKGQRYRFSQQVAIWQVDTYRSLLRTRESAWRTELAGSIRAEHVPQTFLGVAVPCVHYHNLHRRKSLDRKVLQTIREELPTFLGVDTIHAASHGSYR